MVTVIVAAYNVEPYLHKCIASLTSQTEQNLEILIVNDGSTDGTQIVAEQEAKADSRVRVLQRKQNDGPSIARNEAIAQAEGEYLAFVDGDDYVAPDFIETLLTPMVEKNAEISIVSYALVWEEDGHVKNKTEGDTRIIMDRDEALHELFAQQKFECMACQKMFRRDLFNQVRFPEGEIYEDAAVSLPLFRQATRVAYCEAPKYYYVQRRKSIVHVAYHDGKLALLRDIAEMIRYSEEERNGKFNTETHAFYLRACLMLLLQVYAMPRSSERRKTERYLKQEMGRYRNDIDGNPYLEKRKQIMMKALLYHFPGEILYRLWVLKVKY